MSDSMSDSKADAASADHAADQGGDPQGTGAGAAATAEPVAEADNGVSRELEELRERMLRLAAEYDNFRRRAVKERQEAGWRAQGDLVRGILDPLDDIARFGGVDPSTVDSRTVVEGVQLIQRKLVKSLAGHGFEIIDPVGHPFDPALHEAVSTAPAATADEDGLVAQVFQVGYVINGHVLRPARVVVKQWTAA
jgi:molecular chaperone GrpE